LRSFEVILFEHKPWIHKMISTMDIHNIAWDFVGLLRAYIEGGPSSRKQSIICTDGETDFEEAWNSTARRFSALQSFCGDLACACANTATVKSDFSVIGSEKSEYRKTSTDFSLKGILHGKQFDSLKGSSVGHGLVFEHFACTILASPLNSVNRAGDRSLNMLFSELKDTSHGTLMSRPI
jgi:hypothetical protein